MSNIHLKEILKKYEQKRLIAEENLEKRKKAIYLENSRLEEIDLELSKSAISIAKQILSSGNKSLSSFIETKKLLKKEKEDILKSLGKNLAYLTHNYECSICSDTGYVQTKTGSTFCNCLKQELFNIEYNKCNMGNLEKENFSTFNIEFYSNIADKAKFDSDISPRKNILNIKKISEKFISNFDNPDEKNLLFRGNSGLGKTFLCNSIANEILKLNKTVLYQTAPVMLDEIINCRMGKSASNILDNLLNVDLLIIDDLGTETVNSMKFTELFNVINSRLLNQNKKVTKTIISTNLTLQQIYSMYDERIASRIVGYYNICKFFGDDIRFMSK